MRIAFVALIFLFILLSILFFGRNGVVDIINKKAILKEYISRQNTLLTDIETYERQIAALRSGGNLTEDLIKSKLYLTSTNETLFINRAYNQNRYGIYLNISQTANAKVSSSTAPKTDNPTETGVLGDSQ